MRIRILKTLMVVMGYSWQGEKEVKKQNNRMGSIRMKQHELRAFEDILKPQAIGLMITGLLGLYKGSARDLCTASIKCKRCKMDESRPPFYFALPSTLISTSVYLCQEIHFSLQLSKSISKTQKSSSSHQKKKKSEVPH
jgi:hypothetical protein